MAEERRLVISGSLSQVPEACDFVAEAAESVGLDERGVYHCQMAVDEWCTNVIQHGYGGGDPDGRIEIALRLQPYHLVMTITDDSPPFDPTALPEPDPAQPLEDRQPGGLGWFFIRKMMDIVRYELKNGKNTLMLVKKGASPEPREEPASTVPARTLDGGVRVLAPSGRIDSVSARQLESALQAQLDADFTRLIVDMSGVTYISSTGLKALLMAKRRLDMLGGSIALAALSPRVAEVFRMSGFDRLFPIADQLGDAVIAVTRPT
ncbi:MAG: anti-sigma factor antagonist [Anaerolineae bacterium]|nr:anti-sigma factor antagonist [Anaerolineae bacterium]